MEAFNELPYRHALAGAAQLAGIITFSCNGYSISGIKSGSLCIDR
jgi:hypothetical protein